MSALWAVSTVVACLLLAGSAHGQPWGVISPIPKPVAVKTSPVAPGVFELTPVWKERRELSETHFSGRPLRSLKQQSSSSTPSSDVATYGPDIVLGSAIVTQIGSFATNGSAANNGRRRRLLDSPPYLSFVGEIKKDPLGGEAVGSYLFDASTAPFFAGYARSGSDANSAYQFLRALLLYPQDAVYGERPPYVVSEHAFISSDPHRPVIVRLKTRKETDYVPALGLRFDYSQSGTDPEGNPVTEFVSVYYTDLVGSYPWGLPGYSPEAGSPQINLDQSFTVVPLHNDDDDSDQY